MRRPCSFTRSAVRPALPAAPPDSHRHSLPALMIGAAILFLLAVGAYLFWQDRQRKAAEADTEHFDGKTTE